MNCREIQDILTVFAKEHDIPTDVQQWLSNRCVACVKNKRICYEKCLVENGYCKKHQIPKRETTFNDLLEANILIKDT